MRMRKETQLEAINTEQVAEVKAAATKIPAWCLCLANITLITYCAIMVHV